MTMTLCQTMSYRCYHHNGSLSTLADHVALVLKGSTITWHYCLKSSFRGKLSFQSPHSPAKYRCLILQFDN